MGGARRSRRSRRPLGPPPRLRLTLTDMAFEGRALGRTGDKVLFAELGAPGDEAVVEVFKEQPDYALARVVEVIRASADRVPALCPYFGRCGGCQWQHISYERQLVLKRHVVQEQLRRIGKISAPRVSQTVAAGEPWGYRNHMRFSTGPEGELGFVERGSRRFLRIDACPIAHPAVNQALALLQGQGKGLHQVEVRVGVNSGDRLIAPGLSAGGADIESGQKAYRERLAGREFEISAPSFFQSNTASAEKLIEMVGERLELNPGDTLLDAYAGVGTFAAVFAPRVARVIAIEEAPTAVVDARRNCASLANVEVIEGKVEDVLSRLAVGPDAVILDPPRQGCAARALDAVVQKAPRNLVYVSCDPATLARDLRSLLDGGFDLLDVTPLDMFPQTYHTEVVCTLRARRASSDRISSRT